MSKLPSIPSISSRVPVEVSSLLRPMREILLAFTSGADRVATLRELSRSGIIGGVNPDGSVVPPVGFDSTPPPAPTGLSAGGALANIMLSWDATTYSNLAYTEVWRAQANDFSAAQLVGRGDGRVYVDNVGGAATRYYWIRYVSKANIPGPFNAQLGTKGDTGTDPAYMMQLLLNKLGYDQFDSANGVFPLRSETALPALPNVKYPIGVLVYLTTDGKLYRNVANAWTAAVAASDMTGQIVAAQIANSAVTTAKFAAGIEPITIVSAIPGTKVTSSIFNTADGKLYRWNGTAYISTIPASDMTGAIVSTQITDGAISTPKIAAGAVTAGQIAANTITAGQIAAGAINAAQIAAGAITTVKLAAGVVTANELAANAVTAAKIVAGAIDASKLAANSITAGKIAAGAIVAADGVISNLAIGTAHLIDGTITNAKIGDLAVDSAKISSLDAAKINAASLSAISANLGSITSGDINGTTLHGGSGYPTSGYVWPSNGGTGFHLSASGLLLGNAALGKYVQLTADGNLYAPQFSIVNGQATFSGSLNVNNNFVVDAAGNVTIRNATTGARLNITNSLITVYDANGVVRVRLGLW